MRGLLFLAAAISILTTIGIVFELGKEALLFFGSEEASVWEFISSTNWQPAILDFGIWPLVLATLTTSVIAMGTSFTNTVAVALAASPSASVTV